jgi:hypothetical protein
LVKLFEQAAHLNCDALLEIVQPLPLSEHEEIVQDYNAGCSYIAFMSRIKLSFWQELPFRLCGIAHQNETCARAAAADCLAQWEAMQRMRARVADLGVPIAEPPFLSRFWLGEGSFLRELVISFAQGMPRLDPHLQLPLGSGL